MKVLLGCAAVLASAMAMPGANAASRGASCGVTHHDCYPACVKMTPDGSDCAQTRNVCKDICGPAPEYPSVESGYVNRIEMPAKPGEGPVTIESSTSRSRPMDESPTVDTDAPSPN